MTSQDETDIRLAGDMADIVAAVDVVEQIWGRGELKPNLVRAVQHAGGYVAIVHDRRGAVVGASIAFRGAHEDVPSLHSHITGVLPRHRGIGQALKEHQRAWAADRGIEVITWTFDPLVARNCWFNLHKLGVEAPAHLQDHYGSMRDKVNSGERTDRLLAVWRVHPRARPARDGEPLLVLDRDGHGAPLTRADLPMAEGGPVLMRVPEDVEELRRTSREDARRWRHATRGVLMAAYRAGYSATDALRDGGIILARREDRPHDAAADDR